MLTSGIDFEVIEAALVAWAQDATNLTAIWGRERGGQPVLPYIVLDWLQYPTRAGEDETSTDVDTATQTVTVTVSGPRAASISIHVFSESTKPGDNAAVYAGILQTSIGLQSSRDAFLTDAGIGIAGVGVVQNQTTQRDGTSKWISHAVLDVDLNLASNVVSPEIVSYIDSARVEGTVDGLLSEASSGAMIIPD